METSLLDFFMYRQLPSLRTLSAPVSVLNRERARNNGRLFQSNVYQKNSDGDSADVHIISGLSVIAKCTQGES